VLYSDLFTQENSTRQFSHFSDKLMMKYFRWAL
jgi:hypothetical protein